MNDHNRKQSLLFLHGFGTSGLTWKPYTYLLGSGKSIEYLYPDLPGFGKNWDAKYYEELPFLENYATFLDGYLTQHKGKRIHLVGFSFGAYLGLYWLATRPNLKSHIASYLHIDHTFNLLPDWEGGLNHDLFGTFRDLANFLENNPHLMDCPLDELPKEPLVLYVCCLEHLMNSGLSFQFLKPLSRWFHRSHRTQRIALQRGAWPWVSRFVLHYGRDGHDLRALIPRIEIPTQILQPMNSGVFGPAWAQEMTALLPKGSLVKVAGSSHDILLVKPLFCAKVLRGFIDQHY